MIKRKNAQGENRRFLRFSSKNAQEEMIGFVLIVLLVVVIAVVFLGISLRNNDSDFGRESYEIDSFLSSVRHYTTDCEISGRFKTIGDLVVKCNERLGGGECDNGDNICVVLATTVEGILEQSTYVVSEESPVAYYDFRVYTGEDESSSIINPISEFSGNLELGKCPGTRVYNEEDFSLDSMEFAYMKFEVCYRS